MEAGVKNNTNQKRRTPFFRLGSGVLCFQLGKRSHGRRRDLPYADGAVLLLEVLDHAIEHLGLHLGHTRRHLVVLRPDGVISSTDVPFTLRLRGENLQDFFVFDNQFAELPVDAVELGNLFRLDALCLAEGHLDPLFERDMRQLLGLRERRAEEDVSSDERQNKQKSE